VARPLPHSARQSPARVVRRRRLPTASVRSSSRRPTYAEGGTEPTPDMAELSGVDVPAPFGARKSKNGTPKQHPGRLTGRSASEQKFQRGLTAELGLLLVRLLRGAPSAQVVHHAKGETDGLQGAHHELEVLLQRSLLRECLGLQTSPGYATTALRRSRGGRRAAGVMRVPLPKRPSAAHQSLHMGPANLAIAIGPGS
jgi:hypothetical protein